MPDEPTLDFLRKAGSKGGRNAAKRRSPEIYRQLAITGLRARLTKQGFSEKEIAAKVADLEQRRAQGFFQPRGAKPA